MVAINNIKMKLIYKSIGLLSLMAVLFFSCQKNEMIEQTLQPKGTAAGFTFAVDAADPNLVKFTNVNLGVGTTYQWNWGDGKYDTGTMLSHKYPGIGTYKVVLTTTNASGIESIEKNIVIEGIDFSIATNDNTEPLKISITSRNAGCTDVKFEWGDNTQTTTDNPTAKVFAAAGVYTVKMSGKLIRNGSIASKEIKVFVTNPALLSGTTTNTWKYHPTQGLSFFGNFSNQLSCELATEFKFSANRDYLCDNKGSEIRFPNCTSQGPRSTTKWTLSRTNLTEFKLNVGDNTFFGDPSTVGREYVVVNLTATLIECTKVNFGFTDQVNYKMVKQ